jgi:hypothetical protein
MFLTPEQTGGPGIWSLRRHNFYLAVWHLVKSGGVIYEFDIRQLAEALGLDAGETWQGHAQVILSACVDGKLFEWLDGAAGDMEDGL